MVRKFLVSIFIDSKSVLEESILTKLLNIFILLLYLMFLSNLFLFIDISTASPDHEMSYYTVYGQFMSVFKNSPQIFVLANSSCTKLVITLFHLSCLGFEGPIH